MRFSRRTLASVVAGAVAASTSTTYWSLPAWAQDPAAKPDASAAAPAGEPAADPKPLLDKGDAALKASDFPAAMAAFNEAGKAAQQALQAGGGPDAGKAQAAAIIGRGRAYVGLKDLESAEKEFKSILAELPTEITALNALGQLKLEAGHPDEAIDLFAAAVKSDPTNGDALFGYGKSLVQLGRGVEAVSPLTRAIAIDPKNAEAYRQRGSAYAATFKMKQAFEDLHKAIELNADDYESYFTLGVLFMRSENYKDAAEQFGKAIEKYKPKPGHEDEPFIQGYLTRASTFIELGKAAKADSPEQKAAYQASYDEVEKIIKQLDKKNPADTRYLAAALFARGVAERQLGHLGQAVRTFTEAMEEQNKSAPDESTGPFLADAFYRRGICLHVIGEDKMAISDFESASHLTANDPRANLWEGFTYAKLGEYQQALRAYGDAIAASDRFTPAYYNRGLAYMMLGNYKKAIIDFNDAIRLEPANAEYYYKRGLAYEQMGDHQKAAESFSSAIEFDKQHEGAHRHMADVQQHLGHGELSTQYRDKAKQLTPPKKTK